MASDAQLDTFPVDKTVQIFCFWLHGVFHIQIKQEMAGCLDFLQSVYGVFGFEFDLKLSTRPEKYLGEIEVWDMAEKVGRWCGDVQ